MAANTNHGEFSAFAIPDEKMRLGTTDEDIPGGEPGLRKNAQRNRDRIVWSEAFRRMGYKTQVFPHDAPDYFRRRLTHSIEVAQLATSISTILGFNSMATEAIALGHDLGHVAFGHAGERELNKVLQQFAIDLLSHHFSHLTADQYYDLSLALGFGFTHYEQGLRVVEYLEQEYYTKAGHKIEGLGLARPVKDGILKHGRKDFPKQWHKPIYTRILKCFSFRSFDDRPTYLEGQAVTFADYLSYIVSDLEDGIRAKIIRFKDLERSTLIQAIYNWMRAGAAVPPLIDFADDAQYQKFKRLIIKYLMLDTLDATKKRLAGVPVDRRNCEYALQQPCNLVLPSSDVCSQIDEIYEECISERIHKHHLVLAAGYKAGSIIKELFKIFVEQPGLIPEEFREANGWHAFNYVFDSISSGECGISAEDLQAFYERNREAITSAFVARDYVSEMSDFAATRAHMRLTLSSESLYA